MIERREFHPLQAQETARAFHDAGVAYLFIGKSGAILLGYPGTYMMQFDPRRPWTIGTSTPAYKEPAVTAPESNPLECHRWSTDLLPTHFIRAKMRVFAARTE